jgi:ferritin-like metal-binding protein YciE
MEKMTDLQDLLKHEIKDLYSAEEQTIQAMPRMIEKVSNPQLREALERHLRITEGQLQRLEQVQQLMAQSGGEQSGGGEEQGNNGLFSRLMRRRSQDGETGSGGEKCLGMEGLLREGEKVMAEEMEPSVLDAAIIACAQKIEHYEICGYGTARAYARELNMGEVAELLEQTLDEEYEADDRLTDMAIGRVNEEAERGGKSRGSRSSASSSTGRSGSRSTASKSTSRSRTGAAVAAKGSRSGGSSSGRGSGSGSSRSTAASGRGGSSTGRGSSSSSGRGAGTTKAASKTSSSRGGSPAPASKTSSSRTASKSSGRSGGSSSGNTRAAANSRSGKAPSKAAAAKGGRNSSGGGRTASKSTGRGSNSGRSSGRR